MNINCYINAKVYFKMACVRVRVRVRVRAYPHFPTTLHQCLLINEQKQLSISEAALLPPEPIEYTDIFNYQEELVLSLSSAREFAPDSSESLYDKNAVPSKHQVGDLILIRFPHEETGKQREFSCPWHGSYRPVECRDPDLVTKKQFSQKKVPNKYIS